MRNLWFISSLDVLLLYEERFWERQIWENAPRFLSDWPDLMEVSPVVIDFSKVKDNDLGGMPSQNDSLFYQVIETEMV